MIDFDGNGTAIVSFVAAPPKNKKLELTLSEYLVLVKTTSTLEELRVAIFNFCGAKKDAKAHKAAA